LWSSSSSSAWLGGPEKARTDLMNSHRCWRENKVMTGGWGSIMWPGAGGLRIEDTVLRAMHCEHRINAYNKRLLLPNVSAKTLQSIGFKTYYFILCYYLSVNSEKLIVDRMYWDLLIYESKYYCNLNYL